MGFADRETCPRSGEAESVRRAGARFGLLIPDEPATGIFGSFTIPGTVLGVTCGRARVPRARVSAFNGLRDSVKGQQFVTLA